MEASKVSWAAARPARTAADDGSGSDSSGSSGPADFLSSGAPPPAAAVGPPVADGFDLEGLLAELLSEEETKQLQAMQQDYSFEVQENQAEAPGSDADGEDEGASDSDGTEMISNWWRRPSAKRIPLLWLRVVTHRLQTGTSRTPPRQSALHRGRLSKSGRPACKPCGFLERAA